MDRDSKELVKIAAEAAVKPFGDILSKLVGGPAEQVGGIVTDALAAIRQDIDQKRQEKRVRKVLKKAQDAIDNAMFEPRAVPDYILMPLLQGAALQDDETMQDMWANLLANAANPNGGSIPPVFTKILSELSPNDALFLDRFADAPESPFGMSYPEPLLTQFHPNPDPHAVQITLDTLRRGQLLSQHFAMSVPGDPSPIGGSTPIAPTYTISDLGTAFIKACRAPNKP